MMEDQVDNVVDSGSEGSESENSQGRSFGEIESREVEDKPVLIEDKLKAEVSEAKAEGTEESEPKVELTEKGTKLDPNPESATHQLLANERKLRTQMEQVLGNPEMLARFMEQQYGKKIAPVEDVKPAEGPKEFTADDFQNLDDVAKVVNGLQKQFVESINPIKEENQKLKETVAMLQDNGNRVRIASRIAQDAEEIKKFPELDPKSPEFIDGLEEDIVKEYERLDYDEQGGYRGQQSFLEVAKRLISVAQKAKKAGSLKAQTVVKDVSKGKITTSSKVDSEPDTDNLSAGDSIALGISRMFKQ